MKELSTSCQSQPLARRVPAAEDPGPLMLVEGRRMSVESALSAASWARASAVSLGQ